MHVKVSHYLSIRAESWENDRTESAFPLNNANHSPKWGSCYSPRNESYNNENSPSDHPQFSSSSLSSFITSPRFKMIWKARYQSLTSSACICTNSSFGSDEINIDNTHGIFSKLGSDTNTEQDDMDVRGIDLISYIWPCRQPPEAPGSEIATSHSCDVANIDPSRRIARRHKSAMISTAQQNDQRLLQATRSQSAEHSLKSFAMPFHPRRTLESLSTFDLSPAAFLDIRSVNWRELWLTTLLDSPEVFKVSSDRFIWKVAILDLIERRKITLERKLHFPDISTQKKSESKCPECESVSSDVERDSTMNKDDVVVVRCLMISQMSQMSQMPQMSQMSFIFIHRDLYFLTLYHCRCSKSDSQLVIKAMTIGIWNSGHIRKNHLDLLLEDSVCDY